MPAANRSVQWQRAAVTGGAGFSAATCASACWIQEPKSTVWTTSSPARARTSPISKAARLPVRRVRRVGARLAEALTGPYDLVLHFACCASPADYLRLPLETLDAGSLGTRALLAVAERDGARFLLASTSEVYGDPLVHPQREDYWGNVNPVGPRSVYDESKRFAEALVTAHVRAQDADAGIVRLFNTYGPRMRAHDGRAVPTFVCQALAGEPLTVAGDGRQTRSLCYVDDTVDGVLSVAGSRSVRPVNIGGTDEVTVGDIARRVVELTGSASRIEFGSTVPWTTPSGAAPTPRWPANSWAGSRRCPGRKASSRPSPTSPRTGRTPERPDILNPAPRRHRMRVLGINALFHDPAAALVVDGGWWRRPRRSASAGASTASGRCRSRRGSCPSCPRAWCLDAGRARRRRPRRGGLLLRPRAARGRRGARRARPVGPPAHRRTRSGRPQFLRRGAARAGPGQGPLRPAPRRARRFRRRWPRRGPRTARCWCSTAAASARHHLAGRLRGRRARPCWPPSRCRTRSACSTRS